MSGAHQGSLAPWHIILGFEPLTGTDNDWTAAILRTGKFLERWPISDTTGEDATPVRLIECSKSQTIVCASQGVAVMADASSDIDNASFVRYNPNGSSADVSAPTPLLQSSSLLTAAVTPDATLLVGGTRSGHVKVWTITPDGDNRGSGVLLHTFEDRHDSWVSCVAANAVLPSHLEKHPDAKYAVVTGSWNGTAIAHFIGETSFTSVRLVRETQHDDSTYTCMASDEHAVTCADISPDGSLGVVGYSSGEVVVWDIGNGKELYCLHDCSRFADRTVPVSAVRFNQARYWVLIARRTIKIDIVDLETKSSVCRLYGRSGRGLEWLRSATWIGDTADFLSSCDNHFEKLTAHETSDWGADSWDWGNDGVPHESGHDDDDVEDADAEGQRESADPSA